MLSVIQTPTWQSVTLCYFRICYHNGSLTSWCQEALWQLSNCEICTSKQLSRAFDNKETVLKRIDHIEIHYLLCGDVSKKNV